MNQSLSQAGSRKRGRLFVMAAASGAGKTTLVKKLMDNDPQLEFSVSYTTRPQRQGEVKGEDYHYVSQAMFDQMRDDGRFLEYANVFDHYYATSREQVEQMLAAGQNVMLEIDWQGAQQVRENMPDCCSIFIMPPSFELLEERLRGRGTDSEEVIQRRLGDARSDMSHWHEFDYVVVNDDLESAAAVLGAIINDDNTANRTTGAPIRRQVEAILAQ